MEHTLEWDGQSLIILNQVELPFRVVFRHACHMDDVVEAIRRLEVRGAPAIGIAAAFGYVLGIKEYNFSGAQADQENQQVVQKNFAAHVDGVYRTLAAARPTAVNLCWALERMEARLKTVLGRDCQKDDQKLGATSSLSADQALPKVLDQVNLSELVQALEEEALAMLRGDAQVNRAMGRHGLKMIPQPQRGHNRTNILTHCNAGALAASEFGTALGVIRAAHQAGKKLHVYVDETRPLLQGARLTAWELWREGIPLTLITDSMAGFLMYQKKIDMILVGADRIAANGDTANKIGTYTLAVLAREHGIPFYVAAPLSTIDPKTADGLGIVIEEREGDEVRRIGVHAVTLPEIPVYNPAFDVTPAGFISGIITEEGILEPPFSQNIRKLFE